MSDHKHEAGLELPRIEDLKIQIDKPIHNLSVYGDKILCLGGNTHACIAFHAGVLMGLQVLGHLNKVGLVSSNGTGGIVAATLAAAWRYSRVKDPSGKYIRSWDVLTGPAVTTEEDDILDDYKAHNARLHQSRTTLRMNQNLKSMVVDRLRSYVSSPHESDIMWKRLKSPSQWWYAYNKEMIAPLCKLLNAHKLTSDMTMESLSATQSPHGDHEVSPTISVLARVSYTRLPIALTNTVGDTTLIEPLSRDALISHGLHGECALKLDLRRQSVSRLLASCALPDKVFGSLGWHHCDDLELDQELHVGSAFDCDRLAIRMAQAWYKYRLRDRVEKECVFVSDTISGSPLDKESTYRANLENHMTLSEMASSNGLHNDNAKCVDHSTIGCFRPTSSVCNKKPLNVSYEWEMFLYDAYYTRLTAMPVSTFQAIVNWGLMVTIHAHGTEEQLKAAEEQNLSVYDDEDTASLMSGHHADWSVIKPQ